jgi:hypothetical protein
MISMISQLIIKKLLFWLVFSNFSLDTIYNIESSMNTMCKFNNMSSVKVTISI